MEFRNSLISSFLFRFFADTAVQVDSWLLIGTLICKHMMQGYLLHMPQGQLRAICMHAPASIAPSDPCCSSDSEV